MLCLYKFSLHLFLFKRILFFLKEGIIFLIFFCESSMLAVCNFAHNISIQDFIKQKMISMIPYSKMDSNE